MLGVVEVGLLEGEGEAGDIVQRAFHGGNMGPDHGAEVVVTKLDSAFLHALQIPTGVVLLFLESVEDAPAEGVWGIGEFQKGEGHKLDRDELMVRKKVEEDGALFLIMDLFFAGEGGAAVASLRFKMIRAAREVWGLKSTTSGWI